MSQEAVEHGVPVFAPPQAEDKYNAGQTPWPRRICYARLISGQMIISVNPAAPYSNVSRRPRATRAQFSQTKPDSRLRGDDVFYGGRRKTAISPN